MAAYIEPLIRGFGLIPTLLSGVNTLLKGAAFISSSHSMTLSTVSSTNQKAKILEPNEKIERIFQEILNECGLKNSEYKCKIIDNLYESGAVAFRNTIALSSDTAYELTSNNKQKRLCARSIIKHELGHLYYKDSLQKILLSGALTCAFYGTTRLLEYFIPISSLLTLSARTALCACAQLKLLEESLLASALWREKRADDFAIQHTTNSEELLAAAKEHEEDFNDHVENAIHLEFPRYILGQRLIEEFVHIPMPTRTLRIKDLYEQRKNKNQSFEDWVIENRNDPCIGDAQGTHPSSYDRALAFRRASEKLQS